MGPGGRGEPGRARAAATATGLVFGGFGWVAGELALVVIVRWADGVVVEADGDQEAPKDDVGPQRAPGKGDDDHKLDLVVSSAAVSDVGRVSSDGAEVVEHGSRVKEDGD